MRLVLIVGLFVHAVGARAQPECEPLFEQANRQFEAFQPREADSLDAEAVRGAFQAARACYEQQPTLDSTAAYHFAQTYGREAQVLWETRRLGEAAALTGAFFDGPHLRTDSSGVRYLLEWRAFILDQQGDFEAAARTRVRLLDYAPSASRSVRTRIWMDLGANYGRLGWWDEALAIYRSVQRELEGEPDLEPGLRVNLARAYDKEAEVHLHRKHRPGHIAHSLDAAREAVRLLSLGESSREQHQRAFALLTLAEAFRADAQPDSALAAVQRATALAGRLERPSPNAEITSWEVMGRVLTDLGRYEDAEAAFERALVVSDETGVGMFRRAVLDGLAVTAMRTGDYARADSLIRQALHLIEAERASMGTGAETSRAGFWYDYYLTRVSLLLRQGHHEAAFLALDDARARVLRDLRRRRSDQLEPAEQHLVDSLTVVLGELHGRLAEGGLAQADAIRLRDQVNAAEARRAALYDEPDADEAPPLARLQDALAEREQVLLTYHLAPPAHAFVLRPDTLLAVPLDAALDADRIRALMQAVSPQWSHGDGLVSMATASFELAPLATLYELLFAPVAAHVPEGTPLVVVPEGPLAQMPFGLLVEEDPGRFQFGSAPFLLRRHAISTELAAALLLDEAAPSSAEGLVAYGRSRFGGLETASPLRSAYGSEAPPDLPSVRRELQGLGRRFPSAHIALDEAATESSLYERLGEAGLLHLASHAFVAEEDPLTSYIQLSADEAEDGRLHLYELLHRPLGAALVVLSGCSTARGRDLRGEGTLGLHYAVRAAGAASSLGTLWRVDDAATVELMDRFYDHLAEGLRKDVALQRAQIAYLDDHDGLRNSPFFWAAPVLYGDPRPVRLPAASPAAWWWIAGVVLLLGAFALSYRRRRDPAA